MPEVCFSGKLTAMRAILPTSPDGLPVVGDLPPPEPGPGEVLIRVAAAALNRADLLQLKGLYPPPPGESPIPGLECAGTIAALGAGITDWRVGERVMALLAGGGQAELAVAPAGQLLPVPERLTVVEAGGVPEAALTAWTNLVHEGRLEAGQTVLITAAASGIGSFAVQLARELGARVLVAGRSLERLAPLRELGAAACLPLDEELPRAARAANEGRGVDLVLDMVGGPGLSIQLACLAERGRLVLIGLLGGARADLDLRAVLSRRLSITGSVLRPRSRVEKAELVAAFRRFGEARLADGRLRPVISRIFPLEQAAAAYRFLEESQGVGKVVLEMTGPG
ncbi:MAG TPA: NAD(P)H-quinone oxidoreductase [Thermoanaerobaculia bacterium]|nr:NAD(P)H-quinone oxidoreductase [Thermoanaerobaculia bacterium]